MLTFLRPVITVVTYISNIYYYLLLSAIIYKHV